MAELNKILFGMLSPVDSRNHILDTVHIPHGKVQFWGGKASGHAWRHVNWAKTALSIKMPFGLWTLVGPRKHVLDGPQIPYAEGQLLGERTCPGMPDDTLPWAVQRCPNRSITVWVVDSSGPKEAQVQLYLPGGANVPSREGTMTSPGEYNWNTRLRRRCGLMSHYSDHLLLLSIQCIG